MSWQILLFLLWSRLYHASPMHPFAGFLSKCEYNENESWTPITRRLPPKDEESVTIHEGRTVVRGYTSTDEVCHSRAFEYIARKRADLNYRAPPDKIKAMRIAVLFYVRSWHTCRYTRDTQHWTPLCTFMFSCAVTDDLGLEDITTQELKEALHGEHRMLCGKRYIPYVQGEFPYTKGLCIDGDEYHTTVATLEASSSMSSQTSGSPLFSCVDSRSFASSSSS